MMYAGGSSETIANAYLPSYGGQPGSTVSINTYYNTIAASKKNNVITHELGHTFGLNHTDGSMGALIPCTPISDNNSVMFSGVQEWSGFSAYDIIAISTLYPLDTAAKKLYRYKKENYYFYSTDACEIIPNTDGYVFDNDAGYLYSVQVLGTVPLYRSLNGETVKDHKLSTISSSSDDIIIGYLYLTQEPGTKPLYSNVASYEYFPWNYHYLYTTNTNDTVLKDVILGYVLSK